MSTKLSQKQFAVCAQRNWFGGKPHPSDYLVHWLEKISDKKFRARITALRKAWDLLHSTPELIAASELLTDWTDAKAANDAAEERAGECL